MRELPPGASQWLFNRDALDHTPSRDDGISLEEELKRRKTTVEHIQSIALRAGLGERSHHDPAVKGVMATAAVLVHRFYMRRSLRDFSEKLMAPTILFLASKIEEQTLKLRFIVNATLSKWEQHAVPWDPDPNHPNNYPPQSPEYRRWEREILTTEELALEALCFDMSIEHPWVILRRCVRGLDERLLPNHAESSTTAEQRTMKNGLEDTKGKGKGKSRLSEGTVVELGWAIFNRASMSPLVVTSHPDVLAFTVLAISISLIEQIRLSSALAFAAELGGSFQLDLNFDAEAGIRGTDVAAVTACSDDFMTYCEMGLIDPGLVRLIPPEPIIPGTSYVRRLRSEVTGTPVDTKHTTSPITA